MIQRQVLLTESQTLPWIGSQCNKSVKSHPVSLKFKAIQVTLSKGYFGRVGRGRQKGKNWDNSIRITIKNDKKQTQIFINLKSKKLTLGVIEIVLKKGTFRY